MERSRNSILVDVLDELQELADDWEYEGVITPETTFFTELGLESLDIVVLATAAQDRYGQSLPFTEYFAKIGQQERRDVTVGEWVDFIYANLNGVAA